MIKNATTPRRTWWLPSTIRGRVAFGVCLVLLALLVTVGFVGFSVWIEEPLSKR